MSFYEDMGVARGASTEEIRDQYRVLVRLLHPDRISDPVLKEAAEGQMRRFNEMQTVLTDADRRRAYDSSLLKGSSEPTIIIQALPPQRPIRRVPWGSLAWGAAAMVCAGAIVWVSDREIAPAHLPAVAETSSIQSETSLSPVSNEDWRARARTAMAERDQALREVARLRNQPFKPDPAPVPPEAAKTPALAEAFASPLPTPAATQTAETRQSSNKFAGVWLYARRVGSGTKLYAPEFIETQIQETNGQIRGRYRSRYRVTDRAISPSVNFEFQGPAQGTSVNLPFVRDDGVRGQVRLRLISERELELAWTSSASGSASLTSGTAVLVRSQ